MMSRTAFSLLFVALLAGPAATATTAQPPSQQPPSQQRPSQTRPAGKRGAAPREPEAAPLAPTRLPKAAPRSVTFTPEREAAALAFVQTHRSELLPVLEDLKTRQPAEYQRAICDFFWVSETLAAMRQDDPQRHDLALRTWRLETLTHLLTSQLAGQPADAERLRIELEQSVQQLVDVQIETSAYDLKRQEAQLRRAQDRHQRLAERRDDLVRERLSALSQAIERSGSTP